MLDSLAPEGIASRTTHTVSWLPQQRTLRRSVVAAFLISRTFLLFFHLHHGPNLKEYRGYLQQAQAGRTAFVDFPIEYPPLAWWVMRAPGTTIPASYDFRFRLIMGLGDLGSFVLLWRIAAKRRADVSVLVAAVYVITTVLLEYVLYDSLDMLMLLSVLVALAAWLQASASSRPSWWRAAAYAAVAVGASYKAIPIVLLPLLLIGDFRTERRWKPVVWRLAFFLAILVAPFAAEYPDAGLATLGFLRYHVDRGIEIGSTWATTMWVLSRGDPSLRVVDRYASWELAGALESSVLRIASVSAIVALAALSAWAIALRNRFIAGRAYLHLLLVPLGMVVTSKVLSPQYLLWAIPLALLSAIELVSMRSVLVVAASCVTIAGLTTLFYPLGMRYVASLDTSIMLILVVRNAILSALAAGLVWALYRKDTRQRSKR